MTTTVLPYGVDSNLRLDLPPGAVVEYCDAPRGRVVEDPSEGIAAALAHGVDYPPLREATFPGDKIVVAVSDGVPQTVAIVDTVVATLIQGGASLSDITVLTTAFRQGSMGILSVDVARRVHDPADRRQVALLARTSDQMPVFLNRVLLDADVVVSIGCLRSDEALGYDGPCGSLCPTFSDQATQQRFRALHAAEFGHHPTRARAKAQEVAWLLGARFTVQIVPGRGEKILHVLAGDIDAVTARGRDLYAAAWQYQVPRTASLVVAAVEGGPDQQTWDNVARALATAAELAEPDGAIAVCCDLETPPSAALQLLASAEQPAEAVRHLRKTPPPGALAALQVARIVEELHVYLLSRLDRGVVEELGLVPVADAEELARLARSRSSCLLLSGGQHLRVALGTGPRPPSSLVHSPTSG